LKTKDDMICLLHNEMNKLKLECKEKKVLISKQSIEVIELQCLRVNDYETFTLFDMDDALVEHGLHKVDKVI